MAEYTKLNYNENFTNSVFDEFAELIQAIKNFEFEEAFLELCDVVQSCLKYVIINTLPFYVHTHIITWSIVSFILPISAFKHGIRYKQFGCIRNHKNPSNCHHICKYKLN